MSFPNPNLLWLYRLFYNHGSSHNMYKIFTSAKWSQLKFKLSFIMWYFCYLSCFISCNALLVGTRVACRVSWMFIYTTFWKSYCLFLNLSVWVLSNRCVANSLLALLCELKCLLNLVIIYIIVFKQQQIVEKNDCHEWANLIIG